MERSSTLLRIFQPAGTEYLVLQKHARECHMHSYLARSGQFLVRYSASVSYLGIHFLCSWKPCFILWFPIFLSSPYSATFIQTEIIESQRNLTSSALLSNESVQIQFWNEGLGGKTLTINDGDGQWEIGLSQEGWNWVSCYAWSTL